MLLATICIIILLISVPFVFLSSIQTDTQKEEEEDNDDSSSDCDSSYPDVCIATHPPDLNCDDISKKNFRVLQPDPHGFDREEDGIGCES